MSAGVQDLAARYGAAWQGRDLEAILGMHTADTVYHLHGGAEPAVGIAATRAAFAAALAQWPTSASSVHRSSSVRHTS